MFNIPDTTNRPLSRAAAHLSLFSLMASTVFCSHFEPEFRCHAVPSFRFRELYDRHWMHALIFFTQDVKGTATWMIWHPFLVVNPRTCDLVCSCRFVTGTDCLHGYHPLHRIHPVGVLISRTRVPRQHNVTSCILRRYDFGNGYTPLDIADRKFSEMGCRAKACAGGF
jgi:hypothetical protein